MATVLEVKTQAQYNTGTSVESAGNTIAFNASSPIGTQPGSAVITLPGGNTGTAYKEYLLTYPSSGLMVHTFSVDFTNLVMADTNVFTFYYPRGSSFTNRMVFLNFRFLSGVYYFDAVVYSEGNVFLETGIIAITKNVAHTIVVRSQRSSAAGVNDASVQVFVDGVSSYTKTGFINYTTVSGVSRVWVGDVQLLNTGTSGSFRMGDITISDGRTGGMIANKRRRRV